MHCVPKTCSLIRLALPILLGATALAQSWTQRTLTVSPAARNASPLVYDAARDVSLLFGGYDGTNVARADTWRWNGSSWSQLAPAASPTARWGHGIVYDTRRSVAVLHGGYVPGTGMVSDTWEWNGANWAQRATANSPVARGYFGMAYDSVRGRTIAFGGVANGLGLLGDTWEYDGANWTQVTTATAPSPRRGPAMAFDSVRNEVVLFGGGNASSVGQDTWVYNGAVWQQRAPVTLPPARQESNMSFDPLCGKSVLLGGVDAAFATRSGDSWTWDGANWSQVSGSQPSSRNFGGMAFDLQRGETVLFGGINSAPLGDTWVYSGGCGRTMSTVTPPVVGSPAVFRYDYPPTSGAGNLYVHLLTARFAGSYPVNIPGFTSLGLSRCDLTNIFLQTSGFLGASGQESWTVQIPADNFLVGLPFDVQSVDLSLLSNTLYWASSDAEVAIAPPGPQPSAALNMVAIPSGAFQMGSVATGGASTPVHSVTITRPFWVGKYEVTQAQYQAVMGGNPSFFQGASYPNAPQRPVEQVTWSNANAYCAALTAMEEAAGRLPAGYQYRLPTEAEWEYVCRAGTTTEWSTGASLVCGQANIQACGPGATTSVGSFAANPWGLFDVHGNVAEWCLDRWDGTANYPSSAVADPYVSSGGNCILRGGSWDDDAGACRSSFRDLTTPNFGYNLYGFRIVLAPVLVFYPNSALNMVAIQPGTFQMGSVAVGGLAVPVHPVTITRPFWIGKYEVTQAQYQAVIGSNPSVFQGNAYPGSAQSPVESVLWHEAVAYCNALNTIESAAGRVPSGYHYRLPTEAEWEYCCRAGSATEWNTGATLSCGQANYGGNPGPFSDCPSNPGLPTVVGSYAANAWGIWDMHGNVNEWCLDGHTAYTSAAASDPFYPSSGSSWVIRGGGFPNFRSDCRSAYRGLGISLARANWIGFRVVLAPIRPNPALNMVAIQPGTFQMGSTAVGGTAAPVHAVTITRPFWVGKYEVTQAEYQAVRGTNPSFFQGASWPNAPQRPVERVSWNNAMAYCSALTATEAAAGRIPAGYQYRLPTEAEWEYVCRAGTTTEWNTGSGLTTSQANFNDPPAGQTTVVGSYPANPWRLFDTHGNVWEWCLDSWDLSANYPSSAVSDPYVSSGPSRVVRGGGWGNLSDYCRSASRGSLNPGDSLYIIGFRVCLAPVLVP